MKRLSSHSGRQVKTISIHGLNPEAEKLILNRVLKPTINEAICLVPKKRDRRLEFADLSGIWTQDDEREFADAVRDFEKTDPGDKSLTQKKARPLAKSC